MNLFLLHVSLNVKSLIHVHASANLLNLVGVSVKLCKSILSHVKNLHSCLHCQLHKYFFFPIDYKMCHICTHAIHIQFILHVFNLFT